jgi:xanthine dehydrogenase accessory factor
VSFARQLGIADGVIERLVCPIGLPQIKGKEPAVIATALAAQLLMAGERISAPHLSPATQSA